MASGLEADDGQESLEDTYLILLHAEQRTLALKAKFYAEDQKGRAQAAEAAHV
jgi:hypothetical protein